MMSSLLATAASLGACLLLGWILRRRLRPGVALLPVALPGLFFSTTGSPPENAPGLAPGQSTPSEVEAARRDREVAEALLRLATELPGSTDLDLVLDKALRLVNAVVRARQGVILLAQPNRRHLVVRAALGAEEEVPKGGRRSRYLRGEGLAGWIIDHSEPVVIEDLIKDPRWVRHEDAEHEHRSALGVPLVIDEQTLGAMLFLNSRPGTFSEQQLPVVSAAATQVAAALYNAELFRTIRDQATRQGGMIRERRIEASKSNAILESIAEGVLVTDRLNNIILLNAAAERILGLERDQVLGQPASDFLGLFGEAGQTWLQAVQRWSSSELDGQEKSLESQIELEDQDRIVALNMAPVRHEDDFVGTVTTFRDVTQAVEVDRLKSEFVATVSHELRTPMTSIKGYVEMLLMGVVGDINDEQRKFLSTIKNNIDRLGDLVNDLLDISRIESGRVQLSLEAVNVEELLIEIREAFVRRSRLESKPMTIEVEVDEDLPPVSGDRGRLRQVLTNLVDNSFNYTPPDGTVHLSASRREDEIEIRIEDNGIGIAPGEQERVFERFFRGEQALNLSIAGTGLGLSIVRQLVDMHGGRLELHSQGIPGEGTTFVVSLPPESIETAEGPS